MIIFNDSRSNTDTPLNVHEHIHWLNFSGNNFAAQITGLKKFKSINKIFAITEIFHKELIRDVLEDLLQTFIPLKL